MCEQDMLERIVVSTNIQIELKTYSEQYITARATDVEELKAFFGLLYLYCRCNEEQPPKYH